MLRTIGYFAEPIYLRPYRRLPLITISPSSAGSLHGLGMRGPTYVLPMAVDEVPVESAPLAAPSQDIIVIARLTRSKRVEQCIAAASALMTSGWSGKLHIVGDGKAKYVESLKDACRCRGSGTRRLSRPRQRCTEARFADAVCGVVGDVGS